MIKRVLQFVLSMGLAFPLYAEGPGTSSAQFLKIPMGARAIGMGEAYTALADDSHSISWNPAGLAFMNQGQASFLHSQYLQDVSYQYATFGMPTQSGGVAGSILYLGYGDIPGFDTQGAPIGNQSAYSMVAQAGAGWLLGDFSVGATIKGIRESYSGISANGFGADLGAAWVYPEPVLGGSFRAATAIQNLGQGLQFISERQPLPLQIKGGVALVQLLNNHLNVALDVSKPRDNDLAYNGGVEFWFAHILALRAGYAENQTEGSGLRAGLGIQVGRFGFNYAYAGFGSLGLTHRYELTMAVGEVKEPASLEVKKLMRRANLAFETKQYDEAVLLYNAVIQIAPKYKRAQKRMLVAMRALENDERTAKVQKGKAVREDYLNRKEGNFYRPADDPELESLLEISDKATVTKRNDVEERL